jgi:hypothetical protein
MATTYSPTENPGKQAVFAVFRGSEQSGGKVEAAGVEPASRSPEAGKPQGVTASAPKPLAQTLARDSQIDPSLARIVEAWPKLPEAVRAGILAMVKATV